MKIINNIAMTFSITIYLAACLMLFLIFDSL
jgi:hypothetical protein